jgi:hypothetical protein
MAVDVATVIISRQVANISCRRSLWEKGDCDIGLGVVVHVSAWNICWGIGLASPMRMRKRAVVQAHVSTRTSLKKQQ